jgi:predicted esterase
MDAVDDIDQMSVKQLKTFISAAGLSCADCIEKSDLRERARQAASAGPHAPPRAVKAGESKRNLAGLECIVNAPAAGAGPVDLIVVVLHGYGASSDNFSPFPTMFGQMAGSPLKDKRVAWVFPQAGPDHMGTPAWWQIDVMEWMGAVQGGTDAMAKLIRKEFPGMPACRTQMQKLVAEADQLFPGTDGAPAKLCFGGFSQGAMTAMDATLSLPADRVSAVMVSACNSNSYPPLSSRGATQAKPHSLQPTN